MTLTQYAGTSKLDDNYPSCCLADLHILQAFGQRVHHVEGWELGGQAPQIRGGDWTPPSREWWCHRGTIRQAPASQNSLARSSAKRNCLYNVYKILDPSNAHVKLKNLLLRNSKICSRKISGSAQALSLPPTWKGSFSLMCHMGLFKISINPVAPSPLARNPPGSKLEIWPPTLG